MDEERATPEQILEMYGSLSPSEIVALRRAAWTFMRGTRFSSPDDLISEAMNRLLCGRKCPLGVSFGAVLNMTCKSVANADRQQLPKSDIDLRRKIANDNKLDDGVRAASAWLDRSLADEPASPSAEDALRRELRVRKGVAALMAAGAELAAAGDAEGSAVVELWMALKSRSEIMAETGMCGADYDAAAKRAMRLAEKRMEGPH